VRSSLATPLAEILRAGRPRQWVNTLAVARYVWISAAGEGGQPEDVFLSDLMLQLLVVVWAVVFAFGVYTR
jgi:4-hydroxybenzoate polyprenyltransferase